MNILMVSSFLPYPLHSGGHVRLYNLLKRLSKNHTITLVCEKRAYQSEADREELKKYCKEVFVFERKKQWAIGTILKTGLSSSPFLLTGHANTVMQNKIQALLLASHFDLIHIETFYVAQNIPPVTIPTVLVEHNIEYLVYRRYMRTAPFFIRPLLSVDIAKLAYWESYYWKKATKLIAVSENEKKYMQRDDVIVIPNGVDTEIFTLKKKQTLGKTILFIGDFKWIQNKDAALYCIKEVFPNIKKNIPGVKLWIVGKHIPPAIITTYQAEDIIFDQNAPDETVKIYQKADVLLAPIRVGGGTSYKILEAMASGTPVVTTPIGLEGIKAKKGRDLLIGETAQELAEQVQLVCNDLKVYTTLAKNARNVIETHYSWDTITKDLEKVYQQAVLQ